MSTNPKQKIGKFISVQEEGRNDKNKTGRWTVFADNGGTIGWIQWYGPFRKYSFYPAADTVFETVCLNDLSRFLDSIKDFRFTSASTSTEREG